MADGDRARPGFHLGWGLALGLAMTLPWVASLFYFVWWSGHPVSRLIYGATKVFTLVWPLAALWWLRGKKPWMEIRFPDAGRLWRSAPLGVATACVVMGLMVALLKGTPLGDMARAEAPQLREQIAEFGMIEHYILFGVFLAVLHSAVEEYYWRWFVFGNLRRFWPGWRAHAAAAVAFSAHHYVVTSQFFSAPLALFLGTAVGVGGLMWSVMYARQGTLAGAWISHLLIDAGILAVGHGLVHESAWIQG
ncbi:MAG TPA: CPBP family glutamic-type intramembrane protease [Verrucomicrobiales bacterium]|nr:CPBP family glutamic-type intramembrane protease [Verrucomicrobiales bacterium]